MCMTSLSYLFKLSFCSKAFVAPLFRWRGSCLFAEPYCNHFSFINIIFTGLIVYRACNKILTLCCE
uniref:Uncharacterized protein n=1 Tax=Rattus norvegicus TaxID=10116 RepID=Q0ZFT0_RAT|nr:unknown [Rattus norvegicus]